jgi:uncharacterized MAPEG superfamily protein
MPKLLSLVVCMTLFTWLTVVVAALFRVRAWTPQGLMLAFGNRAGMPEATPVAARAQRAAANTFENLVFFAVLALAAQAAGATNERVLLGAQVYVAGVPFLRTGVWAVSIVGLAMMVMGMT